MHGLIADVIDSYDGSDVLIRKLNRLGVCSSADILSRIIHHRVNQRELVGPEKELNDQSLIIISADNIDFMHTFSRVYCGKPKKSFHGTTIQVVQPIPSLFIQSTTNTTGHKRPKLSPYPSPSKSCLSPAPKVKRRARSGLEFKKIGIRREPVRNLPTEKNVNVVSATRKDLNSEMFKISSDEQTIFDEALELCHKYQLQKIFYNKGLKENAQQFSDMIHYLSVTQPVETEKSNIVYYKVLNAIADQKDTLIYILHDLHSTFVDKRGLPYLLIEGDAKLYVVLQAIKFEYGNEYNWLLPLPGDWHLLKNYQIALMKPYFEAGLKELARISGYPIAAIQTCSKFKRTHHFILEWEAMHQVMMTKFLEYCEHGNCPYLTATEVTDILTEAVRNITDKNDGIASTASINDSLIKNQVLPAFTRFID